MSTNFTCPKCGAILEYGPDEGAFCEKCGAKLFQATSPAKGN